MCGAALFLLHGAFMATEYRWDLRYRVGPLKPFFLNELLAFRRAQFARVLAFCAFWVTCYGMYLCSATAAFDVTQGASIPGAGAGVPTSTAGVTSGHVTPSTPPPAEPACAPGTAGCAAAGLAIYLVGVACSVSLCSLVYHAGRLEGAHAARAAARFESDAGKRMEKFDDEQSARLAAVRARRAETRTRWGGGGGGSFDTAGGDSTGHSGSFSGGGGGGASVAPAPAASAVLAIKDAPPPLPSSEPVHGSAAAVIRAAVAVRAVAARMAHSELGARAAAAGKAATGRLASAAGNAAVAGGSFVDRLAAAAASRGLATPARVAAWAGAAAVIMNRVSSTHAPGALDVFMERCPGPYKVQQTQRLPAAAYDDERRAASIALLTRACAGRTSRARARSARCRSSFG